MLIGFGRWLDDFAVLRESFREITEDRSLRKEILKMCCGALREGRSRLW
ncbi:MAG: hypothetical protein PHQ34_13445 [Methanothrix sp.]|nr:hypothetical protein [Methanothrix sp.]